MHAAGPAGAEENYILKSCNNPKLRLKEKSG